MSERSRVGTTVALLLALVATLGPAVVGTVPAHAASTDGTPAEKAAQPRIVGGNILQTNASAQYTVALQTQFDASSIGGCSGTVLDANHVLTAAHCFVKNGVVALAENVRVGVGYHEIVTDAGRQATTVLRVAAIFLHPLFVDQQYPDDVAVVRLATPIDFGLGTVAPLAMAPVGTLLEENTAVRVTGFGISSSKANDFGTLRSVSTRSQIAGLCGVDAPAVMLCTFRTGHAACEGDSGGTATINSGSLLIGVTDIAIKDCAAGLNLFANVAAPEIRTFIDSVLADVPATAAQIPLAPRGGRTIRVTGTPRPGRTLTCRPGRWTGGPKFRYAFVRTRGNSDVTTKLGSKRTHKLKRSDRRWTYACIVEASNAGGTGASVSQNTRKVR